MSEKKSFQNKVFSPGQSQSGRMPPALDIHYADIDEQSTADLLTFMRRLAPFVNYYNKNNPATPEGDWQKFFPFSEQQIERWLNELDDTTPPHLALLRSFLELYKQPQALANQFTGKHLDFFYRDVLRLQPRQSVVDKAHLILQLKNNAGPVEINSSHAFSAGKDAAGVERIYQPTGTTVINHSSVASLRSIYLDAAGQGHLRYAPVANSSDGLGGELNQAEPKWHGFGCDALPSAETGFAIASPVLRMQQGVRTITLHLALTHASQLRPDKLQNAFQVYISGESQWIGPQVITPSFQQGRLTFLITVNEEEEAIVDYDSDIHGYDYDAQAPVIQLFLNNDKPDGGYLSFAETRLRNIHIEVTASQITPLELENDQGRLNATKAFMPFGPQPGKGSRFLIGHNESLNKKLSELTLTFNWQDAPVNFANYYRNYSASVNNDSFQASVTFRDGGSWNFSGYNENLFNSDNATAERSLTFSNSATSTVAFNTAQIISSLRHSRTNWAQRTLSGYMLQSPVLMAFNGAPLTTNSDAITLTLERGFMHKRYRKDYVSAVLEYTKGSAEEITLINEPYTPVLQSLTLSYKAYSDTVSVDANDENQFANSDVQFYHLTYFGQMREHGYQRHLFDFVSDKSVHLLPPYDNRGELLIGLQSLTPGDSVSILFQVAEGSADPDLPQQSLQWSVLCDNYWKPLGTEELISDNSNQLLTSGIIKFVIPQQATTVNTILPSGHIWLKAGVSGDVHALPQLIQVAANAIDVEFTDNNNDPLHLAAPLAANNIAKLKTPLAGVKAIAQPYASFGGALAEQSDAFNRRVSERLRHKDRAISAWDYERLVLDAFPGIHKVKAIPHANPTSWLAPGNVMVVVVPDLTNKNAVNPLQPRADSNTLSEIGNYLNDRTPMQVTLHVRNPRYQQVQLAFKVKFHTGYEFNYYHQILQNELLQNLSPWAYSSAADIQFGGKIYKSVLVDFIEELSFVDFITDVRLYSFVNAEDTRIDSTDIQPQAPDIILVSAEQHMISEY